MKTRSDQRMDGRFLRRFPLRMKPLRSPLGAIPLSDVVLLLFLFWMVQSPFVKQPAIRMDLPAAPLRDAAPYGPLIVTVTQEGMVFFNDQRTTLEGLRTAFTRAAHDHPDVPLIVEADERVFHGTLVQIYRMAMAAGIREVALAAAVTPEEDGTP